MSARRERLRIAMFAHNYLPHPGGLEVMVWNLARGLAERHDVVLVTSAFDGASGVSREDGMEVHRLPTLHVAERMGVPYPIPLGGGVRAAMHATSSADVVHAHGALYLQTVLARRVARRAGARFVLTEHVGFVEYPQRLFDVAQRVAWGCIGDSMLRRADAVVTYNARVHRWLSERGRRVVDFIGNGVDFARFRPRGRDERRALRRSFDLPEEGVVALFVGRDAGKKNLDTLLRARRAGYTLAVCGAQRNLSGGGADLIDLGVVAYDRMADLFASVDLMVHPASGEGFPLAVQESVASGVPVVLLWDEGYGRWMPRDLVVACDALDEIEPALAGLAADATRRVRLAAEGRDWAEQHWSWAASVAAYEQIYDEAGNHA